MRVRMLLAALAVFAWTPLAGAAPVSLDTFLKLARPSPTKVVRYGPAASQAVDVFLPAGEGPHPVAILIHGGCWSKQPGAGREQLRPLGKALADRGIAVWSLGYRRADEAGGGYPGTFQDVATAIDLLRRDAARFRLDLARNVLIGHSAGGHLALWAAARRGLPSRSRLYKADPFVPRAVVSLAGIGDLRDFAPFAPVVCGLGIIERLTGGRRGRFAEISPAEMAAPGAAVVMISAVWDRIVPPFVAHDYVQAMRQRHGVAVEEIDIPASGHFDLVTPGTSAWSAVMSRIVASATASP